MKMKKDTTCRGVARENACQTILNGDSICPNPPILQNSSTNSTKLVNPMILKAGTCAICFLKIAQMCDCFTQNHANRSHLAYFSF
jgi:hypothetical protein